MNLQVQSVIVDIFFFVKYASIPVGGIVVALCLLMMAINTIMGHDKETMRSFSAWKKALISTLIIVLLLWTLPTIYSAGVSIGKGIAGDSISADAGGPNGTTIKGDDLMGEYEDSENGNYNTLDFGDGTAW